MIEQLSGAELATFLEREGLLAELEQWRLAPDEEGRASIATTKRIHKLERVAGAAALLVLKKNWIICSRTRTTTPTRGSEP